MPEPSQPADAPSPLELALASGALGALLVELAEAAAAQAEADQ